MDSGFRSDPAVVKWLDYYDREHSFRKLCLLHSWYVWLQTCEVPEYACLRGLSPTGLVEFQENAAGKSRFMILDAAQKYIRSTAGTYKGLMTRYSMILNFFKKNRAPLPEDDFKIKASRPPIKENLNVKVIRSLIENSEVDFKAFYLTLWMGLLDQERFSLFNQTCASSLTQHIKEKGVDEPYLFEYPGRKQEENMKYYYTYIGHDALAAWQEYFERMRGYPKQGEPILLDQNGQRISKMALYQRHMRLLEKLNYIKRGGSTSNRYGFNMHLFRDEAKTLLHVSAKSEGFDMQAAEFWMGHTTDPNQYDKFYRDRDYTLKHYRTAEKYLNITKTTFLSQTPQDMSELVNQIVGNPPAWELLTEAMAKKLNLVPRKLKE